jgi:hypothetical protein
MLPSFHRGKGLHFGAQLLMVFGRVGDFTHHNMLANPDEAVATKDQVDVVLLKVMEMLLPPFYQICGYCEQLTPLELHKET